MKKNKLYTISILIILIIFFGGIYKFIFTPKKVTLTLGIQEGSSWGVPQGKENKVIDDAIRRFEKENPGIEIEYESGIRKTDYSDWLSNKLLKGEQPDIFLVPDKDFNLLASIGALKNLDSSIDKYIDPTDYYNVAFDAGKYENSQYALPFESNPMMMCINKDLLEKSGYSIPKKNWSIENFFNSIKSTTKDTNNDGTFDQFGIVGYNWYYATAAYNSNIFTKDKINLNTNQTRKAFNLIEDINTLTGNNKVSVEDFDKGKVVFRPMSMAEYRTYKPYPYHISKYSRFEWTCVPMPSQTSKNQTTQVDTSLFAISARTKHVKQAWKFLKFLSNDEVTQQELMNHSQGVSVLKSTMKSKETQEILQKDNFGSNSLVSTTIDQMMSSGFSTQKFKKYNLVYEEADYLIKNSIEKGTLDFDIENIEKRLNLLLK